MIVLLSSRSLLYPMSRLSGRTIVDRDYKCSVLNCTSDAGSRTCIGQNCSSKICAMHYGKSALCRSCIAPPESDLIVESSFTIVDISPIDDVRARSKFKKNKFFKNWSDDSMLHLCKQVQLYGAHIKTGDTMVVKWEKVTTAVFSSFPSLETFKWQALQLNYQQTAKSLKEFAITNQRSNLSAEEMEPGDWQCLMLSLSLESENAELSRKSAIEKVVKEKRSMLLIEDEILNRREIDTQDSNEDTSGYEDTITSNTLSVQSTKRAKTSIRSASPLPLFDLTASAEADKIMAEVCYK